MLSRWLALVLIVGAVVCLPRGARADQSTAHSLPVAVLTLDSDDAEEHADALTGALRSRVRASQGWSLIETTQSLGMLTAALRCPAKPVPAECEQRIAEQLKSDRYIFGYVMRGPQVGQVTAEVHLYQKNKPDTVIRESYSENLTDQNDDALRKIAQRILERLGGNVVGAIVVRMGTENGEVVVDGDKRVSLQNGSARLELSPGGHSVEVVVNGHASQRRNVLVTAGKETVVDLGLAATEDDDPFKPSKPFPTKKVVGAAALAIGVGLGAFAVERTLAYFDAKSEFDSRPDYKNGNLYDLAPGQELDVCEAKLRGTGNKNEPACNLSKKARSASTTAVITGLASGLLLGAGVYLFFMSPDSAESSPTTGKRRGPRLVPIVGYGSGGFSLSGSF
jgi:hypothetical protein